MLFLAPDEDTWVGVLRLKLQIPGSRSLKDRRRAVAHVRDRIRARGGFSVSEVGHLHDHGQAVLAVVTVSHDATEVRRALDRLAHEVEGWGRALVATRDVRMFRPFDGHEDDSDVDSDDAPSDWGDDIPDAPWGD
jgi:uncharacterized protein YlxP (DUF503 family)